MTYRRFLNQAVFAVQQIAGSKGNRKIYKRWCFVNFRYPYPWNVELKNLMRSTFRV